MSTIKTLNREEVATILGVSPETVTTSILNGTMPIGMAYNVNGNSRTVIIEERWEKWVRGTDLESKHIKIETRGE